MNVLTSDHHYFGTFDFPYGDEDDQPGQLGNEHLKLLITWHFAKGVMEALEGGVLATLNTHIKRREKDNLKVGDVVVIADQKPPRGQ